MPVTGLATGIITCVSAENDGSLFCLVAYNKRRMHLKVMLPPVTGWIELLLGCHPLKIIAADRVISRLYACIGGKGIGNLSSRNPSGGQVANAYCAIKC